MLLETLKMLWKEILQLLLVRVDDSPQLMIYITREKRQRGKTMI